MKLAVFSIEVAGCLFAGAMSLSVEPFLLRFAAALASGLCAMFAFLVATDRSGWLE